MAQEVGCRRDVAQVQVGQGVVPQTNRLEAGGQARADVGRQADVEVVLFAFGVVHRRV